MPFEANVIRLNVALPAQQAAIGRVPIVLASVRNEIAGHLRQVLQALFESADDWLFDIADHAADPDEQHAFFEAMRNLRINRPVIERSFQQRVFAAFASIGPDDPQPQGLRQLATAQPPRTEHPRAPCEAAALAGMAERVAHLAAEPLAQLTLRIDALTGRNLPAGRNPFGPEALCGYFLDACRCLGVEARIRLVMLGLFERYMVADLDRLYRQSNRTLAAAGVLPGLRVIGEHEPGPRPGSHKAAPTGGASSRLVASLLPLLARREQALRPQRCDRCGDRSARGEASAWPSPPNRERVAALVAMLFERIEDDRQLPAPLRALLHRLLPPFTQLAQLDDRLFEQHSHPARRLLDEIASAAIGWNDHDDLQADPGYRAIEQITRHLATCRIEHLAAFQASLARLRAVTSEERRRSELLTQRTLAAERARTHMATARAQVETALDSRLFGKQLPEPVVRLLHQGWSRVLLQIHLRHGARSPQWQAALRTMDELLWSTTLADPQQSRARLLQRLPGMLEALRQGLAAVAFDPFATADFFAQLEAIHLQAAAPGTPDVRLAGKPYVVSERLRLSAPGDAGPDRTTGAGGPSLPPAFVERLRPGCWVEFREDDQHRLRCRLAALLQPGGLYLFVNRSGIKVLEKSASGLASDLQRGALQLLDDGSAFGRAFDSVGAELQRFAGHTGA